jgi:K+-transporting ATPase c subunit
LIDPLKTKDGSSLASQKHNRTASSNMFPATHNMRENSNTSNKVLRETGGWNKSLTIAGAITAAGSGIITEESQAHFLN